MTVSPPPSPNQTNNNLLRQQQSYSESFNFNSNLFLPLADAESPLNSTDIELQKAKMLRSTLTTYWQISEEGVFARSDLTSALDSTDLFDF